jgi:hypothetical protein
VLQQHEGSQQQLASQQPLPAQQLGSQQLDFSQQQQDGSHAQPHPQPTIRSSRPPKLGPAIEMLSMSAPNRFHFIEQHLLLAGVPVRHVSSADFQQRAMSPHAERSSAATAVAPARVLGSNVAGVRSTSKCRESENWRDVQGGIRSVGASKPVEPILGSKQSGPVS